MARPKTPPGKCRYCGKEVKRRGAKMHLDVCPMRRTSMEAAEAKGRAETLYHLRVQDRWSGAYWLDLEMRGTGLLDDLDTYLRRIWLECCDHLSQFSVGGWRGSEIDMEEEIRSVFRDGVELTHIYDFGTETASLVRSMGTRRGAHTNRPHPIALMARNTMPESRCAECGRPAAWLCVERAYAGANPTLCDDHAPTHPHDEYGELTLLVNSPRVGKCGYDGPAEPPY